jgi:hypothetical protein
VSAGDAATATPPAGGEWATAADRQAAARDAFRRSAQQGEPLTAAALAGQFDRSLRWAQERIAEVRNERSADTEIGNERNRRRSDDVGRSAGTEIRSKRKDRRSDDHGRSAGSDRRSERNGWRRSDDDGRSAGSDGRSERNGWRRSDDDGRSAGSDGRSGRNDRRSGDEEPRHVQHARSMGRQVGSAEGGRVTAPVRPSRAGQRFDTLVATVVALVAAAASYEHQRTLAELAGEGALAWALPISVDGMMLATSRSILRRRRASMPVPFLSWFGLALGFLASVAANVAAAEPTLIGRLLAAWPPVALFITYETLAADHGELRDR